MRCPKCHYISFDSQDRCRNCGYDLSLAAAGTEDDLSVKPPEADPTLQTDLDLSQSSSAPVPPRSQPRQSDAALSEGEDNLDLPLFDEGADEERPVVLPPSARAPASPRRPPDLSRSTERTEVARHATPEPSLLEAASEEPAELHRPVIIRSVGRFPPPEAVEPAVDERNVAASAPLRHRVLAGLVDAAVLGGIDLVVVWLTLEATGLRWADLRVLPVAPLAGFLGLLDVGYLVTFTATSGRTIGKTLLGLRVVGHANGRVPFGHAVVRAVVCLLSALPLGLGLLPVFLGADHRAWHDRLTGTRVVIE